MNSIEIKKNYNWIDNAKLLSIFLVILFHTAYEFHGILGKILAVTRMPMFFFLSGLLFKSTNYPTFKEFAFHRGKQLLIPYFYFFIILYIYWIIYGRKNISPEESLTPIYQPIIEYALGRPESFNIVMWFIPCLFIIQCLYYIILKQVKHKYIIIILGLSTLIPFMIDLSNAPFSLDSVFKGLTFYGIASLYSLQIISFVSKNNYSKLFTAIAALLLAIFSIHIIYGSTPNLFIYILTTLSSFLMIYFTIIIIKKLSKNKCQHWVKYMTSNAIVILALHTYSNMILHKILQLLNIIPISYSEQFLYKLIISAVTLLMMYIPIKLINTYTPFIIGRN